jgi:hypothetical protein
LVRIIEPPAGRESGTDIDDYIAKKRRREEARREPDDGDVEDELEYMDEDGPDAVEAIQNLGDEPVADRMLVDEGMDNSGWPGEYHMAPAPSHRTHRRIDSPSDETPVAGPSGLSTEEKEKENTPGMEVEDVAGPSGNPAENAKPAEVLVKVEEKEDENRVQYEIVEVAPTEPVVEETPAATVEGGEAVVEPKLEPVEPVILPVIVPWTKKGRKKLRITTCKIADKDVIEILDSEDEVPVEEGGDDEDEGEDGKEPDAQDGGETAPDS